METKDHIFHLGGVIFFDNCFMTNSSGLVLSQICITFVLFQLL